MRWEDERYVRLYTRDTADWLMLSLEAQGLLALLLRKADRAGIIDLGRHGKRSVAILVGHASRWDVLEPALDELLADGVMEIRGENLVFRNYIEAQNSTQTDRMRKEESRSRARDVARASGQTVTIRDQESQAVTNRDGESQFVTKSHKQSQAVTDGHSVPCRAVPNRAVPSRTQAAVAAADDDQAVADFALATPSPPGPTPEDLRRTWNQHRAPEQPEWRETSPKRATAARARLRERPLYGSPDSWEAVVRRVARSSFARGLRPGTDGRVWVADPEWLLRPDSATKTLEGRYDDRTPVSRDPWTNPDGSGIPRL